MRRRGLGDDDVALDRDRIGTRGGHIHQAGHDRLVRLGTKSAQLVGHDVARCDAAAGTIDPDARPPRPANQRPRLRACRAATPADYRRSTSGCRSFGSEAARRRRSGRSAHRARDHGRHARPFPPCGPGSTDEGILTSSDPRSDDSVVMLPLTLPWKVAATGKAWHPSSAPRAATTEARARSRGRAPPVFRHAVIVAPRLLDRGSRAGTYSSLLSARKRANLSSIPLPWQQPR